MFVSSAYYRHVLLMLTFVYDTKRLKTTGPKMLHWGTLYVNRLQWWFVFVNFHELFPVILVLFEDEVYGTLKKTEDCDDERCQKLLSSQLRWRLEETWCLFRKLDCVGRST